MTTGDDKTTERQEGRTVILTPADDLTLALRGVRWFGEGGYEISEDVPLGPFPLDGYEVRVSVRGTRCAGDGVSAVGITARYEIFEGGKPVPFSCQRGVGPVFSVGQILDSARRWLATYAPAR